MSIGFVSGLARRFFIFCEDTLVGFKSKGEIGYACVFF